MAATGGAAVLRPSRPPMAATEAPEAGAGSLAGCKERSEPTRADLLVVEKPLSQFSFFSRARSRAPRHYKAQAMNTA